MKKITVTELTHNPGQNAQQVLADLYRTLPPEAAKDWLDDARRASDLFDEHLRDPSNPPG